jgi:NADH-quinone oxidoreductase subunit C
MTPEEVGARFTGVDGRASVSGGGDWARATVHVDPRRWTEAILVARDELDCDFFDWLSAVDELDAGLTVVTHLWSTRQHHGVLLETGLPADAPAVASIVALYPGAAWHERETHEMFGIDFTGHPGGLRPLLLPPEFEGYPLRKQFVLASRVAKPWPGAKEPGESHEPGAARRAPMRPPGVPAPGEWGPEPPEGAAPVPPRERPARPLRAARPAAAPASDAGDRPAAGGASGPGETPASAGGPATGSGLTSDAGTESAGGSEPGSGEG